MQANREIYVRHTSTTGAQTLSEHRVWDADRFYAARQADVDAENARAQRDAGAKPITGFASVEPITRAQYLAQRKPHNART